MKLQFLAFNLAKINEEVHKIWKMMIQRPIFKDVNDKIGAVHKGRPPCGGEGGVRKKRT